MVTKTASKSRTGASDTKNDTRPSEGCEVQPETSAARKSDEAMGPALILPMRKAHGPP